MLHVSTKLSLAGPTLRQSKTLQVNCSVLTQTLGLRVVWIYVNTLFFDCNQENVFQSLINYEMQEHWHNTLTNLHIVNST